MEFMDLALKRESVRASQDRPVERELIERCVEAARLAPSSRNAQPWKFIVVDEPQMRQRIAYEASGKLLPANPFSAQAPVMVVLVTMPPDLLTRIGSKLYDRPYELIDNGIAAEHFCLQAAELGLGTCMLGIFDEKAIKKHLSVPRHLRISMVITLGYPVREEPRPKQRKALSQILSYNNF